MCFHSEQTTWMVTWKSNHGIGGLYSRSVNRVLKNIRVGRSLLWKLNLLLDVAPSLLQAPERRTFDNMICAVAFHHCPDSAEDCPELHSAHYARLFKPQRMSLLYLRLLLSLLNILKAWRINILSCSSTSLSGPVC